MAIGVNDKPKSAKKFDCSDEFANLNGDTIVQWFKLLWLMRVCIFRLIENF